MTLKTKTGRKVSGRLRLWMLLSLLLAGCAASRNPATKIAAGTEDIRPYHWELQALLRPGITSGFLVFDHDAQSQTIFPLQTGPYAGGPYVMTRDYEDYTARQMSEIKARLLNSGLYLAVSYRKLPGAPEH